LAHNDNKNTAVTGILEQLTLRFVVAENERIVGERRRDPWSPDAAWFAAPPSRRMASGRRPGKRSIVGSRVCAPLADGLLYPGVIVSVQPAASAASEPPSRTSVQQSYAVRFDAGGSTQTFRETDVFGVGFQTVTAARLKPGQTVYITLNGREVKGSVDRRYGLRAGDAGIAVDEPWNEFEKPCAWDEVWVLIDGETRPIRRKVISGFSSLFIKTIQRSWDQVREFNVWS